MGRYRKPRPAWTRKKRGDRQRWYGQPQKELKHEPEPEKDEEDMVLILESAKFDRKALLGDDADEAARLERPGNDYQKAAYLIWLSMVKAARRDGIHMVGNNDRSGWAVEGIGPSQVLDLLWPTLVRGEKDRARTATVRYLKDFNNALVIEQGRLHSLPKWWVAEEWETPVMKRKDYGKARVNGEAVKRTPKPPASNGRYRTSDDVAAQVDEFISENNAGPTVPFIPPLVEPAPADTLAAPVTVTEDEVPADIPLIDDGDTQSELDWLTDQLNALAVTILQRFYRRHDDLVNENAELRDKLDTIRKAMQ